MLNLLVIYLPSCDVWHYGVLLLYRYGDLKPDMIAAEVCKWYFPTPKKLYLSRQVPSRLLLMFYASLSLHLDASGCARI